MTATQQNTLGIGIIGCGVIGRWHATAASELDGVQLAALADLDRDRAEQLARELGPPSDQPSISTEAGDVLTNEAVDVVVVAMPVKGRAQLARLAFEAGKHVLIEKPAAMDAEQLQSLIDARDAGSTKHGKTLRGGGCSCRHSLLPSALKAAEVVGSGRLGAIRVVRVLANKAPGPPPEKPPPVWRVRKDLNAGGIMSNWGVYDLDYVLSVCRWQLEPRTVLGQVFPVGQPFEQYVDPDSNAETHAVGLVRCAGGEVLTLDRGEFIPLQTPMRWQIVGERASLHCPMLPGDSRQLILDEADADHGTHRQVIYEGDEPGRLVHLNPLRDLSEAIRDERPPATAFERGMVIQKITDALYASAQTGEAVRLA